MEISRADLMMGYVESYYRESLFYTAQNNAKGEELDIIHAIIEDMPNQFNPQTATWGLGLWEEMLGISRGTEKIAERRSRVMMKLLTLQRITPISLEHLIKSVAGVNADIIRNTAPYTFQVRIKDDSLECNSSMIRKIVEDYKEAHMAFYQAYYLGEIVLKEQFYFKEIQRMGVYWFGEYGELNIGFLPLRVRNQFLTFHLEEVYLKSINHSFSFMTKENFLPLTVHTFVCYWWRESRVLLNGKYSLNGEVYLDQSFPPYKLNIFYNAVLALQEINSVKAMWNTFRIENALKFEIRNLFRYKVFWWDEGDKLDEGNRFPEYKTKLTYREKIVVREVFSAPIVTISHNLWYLDGAVSLDGSQILDAYQSKEVLELAASIVTDIAREKMLKARAGVASLPKIVGMVFGDGAKNASGGVIPPVADQTELRHELLRKEIDRYEVVSRLVYRYVCTLNEGELANKYINEVALYDEDGDLIAIKSFLDKGKDEDQEMGFEIDDTF